MSIKNTQDLRVMLIESIEAVKNGKMTPREAVAIGNLSAKVLQSAKLDLEVLKYHALNADTSKAGDKVLQLVNS